VDSLAIGKALVRVDPTRASVDDVIAAVARTGYQASPAEG
jgi:hypothetical protein